MLTKISSVSGRKTEPVVRPLFCVLINQLAFPGLGSLLARRWVAGISQALLMLAGFILIMAFMLRYFTALYHLAVDPQGTAESLRAEYAPFLWARNYGLILCLLAWLWALVSSISISRAQPPALPPDIAQPKL